MWFNQLFRYDHREPDSIDRDIRNRKVAPLFFSGYTPYTPLACMPYTDEVIPIMIDEGDIPNRWGRVHTYADMVEVSVTINPVVMLGSRTVNRKRFAIGSGSIYLVPSVEPLQLVPIFQTVVPSFLHMSNYMDLDNLIYKYKDHIEVFLHNDIRSVSTTLWNDIRERYIPLLQREQVRFFFKPPEKINELTLISYQKPQFTDFEQMNQYQEEVQKSGSLDSLMNEYDELHRLLA